MFVALPRGLLAALACLAATGCGKLGYESTSSELEEMVLDGALEVGVEDSGAAMDIDPIDVEVDGGGASGVDAEPDAGDAESDATADLDGGDSADAGDACPPIVLLPGGDTHRYGGTAPGTDYIDICPGDEVVVGVSGQIVTSGIVKVGSIQGACGMLLAAGPSCQIRIDPGATLAERGVKGSSFFTQRCPPDSVVVAFRGHYGAYLDQLSLECAPLSLSIDSRPTVSTGRTTVIAPNGGAGGTYFEERCPRDEVARGMNVRVDGNGYLQSLGFTCGDPAAR